MVDNVSMETSSAVRSYVFAKTGSASTVIIKLMCMVNKVCMHLWIHPLTIINFAILQSLWLIKQSLITRRNLATL